MNDPLITLSPQGAAPLHIRMAGVEDAPEIHRMIAALAVFLGDAHKHVASVEDYVRHGFGETPAFQCVLAEQDGRVLGLCLYFDIFSSWMGVPGLYVQDLYVSDEARGLKLGRLLLQQVAKLGAERGCGYLRLSVDAANIGAQGFYEACGLQWSGSEKMYMALGEAFNTLAGRA
ncbi:GNAT family N-acetyltransferase [uncultured Cohaesibacter sp.]|uniref:GNAT family N-acetyltransferase n=1 Tax=uncultured Cohaesibacter sp. TaxID=1002546 RepID=UPI0029C9A6D4|nr:GNAT family N-acetyltransferase [uncultured Cohaesibacter sp.]